MGAPLGRNAKTRIARRHSCRPARRRATPARRRLGPSPDSAPSDASPNRRRTPCPAAGRAEPRAWAATTPAKGLPTITDAQPYGYFGGQPADTSVETAQRPAGTPPPRYPELSTSTLLRQVKPPPSEGWRRWLYMVSGKLINLGESPRVNRYNDLVVQVNRPLRGCYRIALLSLKGGVGKTTITATLGGTFASIRGDRVVAVDANPDRGTLSQKVPVETPATVRHLLRDADGIDRYSDVRSYTSVGPAGWKCWPRKPIRRCRRRSAPTIMLAPSRSSSGSTAWCSPTAAPGYCIRRCRRCWPRPTC
ncbi:cobQ/CobB/MinD/ParA nucleotide binding domain protein [Mycobacterium kansasii]|uniref:CobQ/CobB/MinD/ParA nucleotide binding domain protein n=1 Tax=Mycobacterium kansasii TaxID=1768 RepID=A0A1V3WFM0_MYCKA|nr:cobQ/CobB/MinD/ParA nucleotide binding domain protein [Mycobacterium kansasii]